MISKEAKTGSNLSEFSKEGDGSKSAVMLMMMTNNKFTCQSQSYFTTGGLPQIS
jgi:hypothetical protein